MFLIDTHVHFDDASFDADRAAAYARARAAGVMQQIIPAIHADNWVAVKQVCRAFAGLHPAYGLHPVYLARHQSTDVAALKSWLQSEKAVAVGECGLDYYLSDLDRIQQDFFFTAQLELAKHFDLPVIIHARHAVEAVIQRLRCVGGVRGVIHSFGGSEVQAKQLIKMGFYLSFGGPVTYAGAHKLRRLVQVLPLDSLLLETDAPDQPFATRRGERNEPAYLPELLAVVAMLRQQDAAEIMAQTTENAVKLFRLSSQDWQSFEDYQPAAST